MYKSLKFGDIFKYYENEYIFLVEAEEGIVYAAKILDKENSRRIENYCNRGAGGQQTNKEMKKILYCYIKLTSENFKNRIAHFKDSARDENRITCYETGFELNIEDKKALKKEIIDPESPLPRQLKELVNELDI